MASRILKRTAVVSALGTIGCVIGTVALMNLHDGDGMLFISMSDDGIAAAECTFMFAVFLFLCVHYWLVVRKDGASVIPDARKRMRITWIIGTCVSLTLGIMYTIMHLAGIRSFAYLIVITLKNLMPLGSLACIAMELVLEAVEKCDVCHAIPADE